MYWTVAVSCVLGAFRAGPTEQGLVSLTEEAFGFLVCHTDLLLRAVVVVSSGLSGKGNQPLEDNIGFEIGRLCAFREYAGQSPSTDLQWTDWSCRYPLFPG